MPRDQGQAIQDRIRQERLAWARSLPVGQFAGDHRLKWIGCELFDYFPEPDPLRFVRANGQIIQPGRYDTDGGTVNVFLQLVSGVTRWKYGLPFIIHDWMWHVRGTSQALGDFGESNLVLAEAMRTMMHLRIVESNYHDIINVYTAVQSPIARRMWNKGITAR